MKRHRETPGIIRVHKRVARKHFDKGNEVLLQAVNLSAASLLSPPAVIFNDHETDFDKLVNAFSYYNCTTDETGRYPAFYIRKEAANV